MIKGLEMTIKMDRGIDRDKHYITTAGFEVETVNKDLIKFDFMECDGSISEEDPRELKLEFWGFIPQAFPEAANLDLEDITRFTQIHIRTETTNRSEIYIDEISKIVLSEEKEPQGEVFFFDVDKSYFQEINEELKSRK